MPKDYAHRAQMHRVNRTGEKKRLKFPWKMSVILVVLICSLVFIIIYANWHQHLLATKISAKEKMTVASEKKSSKEITENQANPAPIKFDFYTMLPKMSIDVVDQTNESVAPTVTQKNVSYLLQLASLSNLADAKAFQEKVDELGYHTKLESFVRGNVTWYRIQLGPYKDLTSAEAVRDQLREHQINGILLGVQN